MLQLNLPVDDTRLRLRFPRIGNVYMAVDFWNRRIRDEVVARGGEALCGFRSTLGLLLPDSGQDGGADWETL